MYGCTNDVHIQSKSRYVYVEDFARIIMVIFMCGRACGFVPHDLITIVPWFVPPLLPPIFMLMMKVISLLL